MALIQGKQIGAGTITSGNIADGTILAADVSSQIIIAAGTNPLTANWALGGFSITGMADPVNPQDAATKNYVDAAVQGLDVKISVRLATTAALAANTRTGNVLTASANGALGTIDSVAPALNDRILVKNEATAANNGLYTVTSLGSVGTPWTMTRTTDADTSAEVTAGLFTFVEEGTVNADSGWQLVSNQPITLNTTALSFTQFSGAGAITAGAGLLKTGTTIDLVINAGSTAGLTANADDLQINYTLVGALAVADAAAAAAGTAGSVPRGDHKHLVSTAAPSVAFAIGSAAAAGSASTLLRSDATFTITAGTPVDVGTANAAGAATTFSRSDHVHRSTKPHTSNKNMTCSVTASDGDAATATTVATNNSLSGMIAVTVNGVAYVVGDGTKISVDCYFSGDAGVTARAMSAVVAGDSCRWNGSVVGFQLAATDKISFIYNVL